MLHLKLRVAMIFCTFNNANLWIMIFSFQPQTKYCVQFNLFQLFGLTLSRWKRFCRSAKRHLEAWHRNPKPHTMTFSFYLILCSLEFSPAHIWCWRWKITISCSTLQQKIVLTKARAQSNSKHLSLHPKKNIFSFSPFSAASSFTVQVSLFLSFHSIACWAHTVEVH